MITGDLDLERAERDAAYRRQALRFLDELPDAGPFPGVPLESGDASRTGDDDGHRAL